MAAPVELQKVHFGVLKAINIPPILSYCFQLCMASSAGLVRKLETYPVCIHPEIIGIDIQHEWMDGWIDRWMQNCLDVLFVLDPKQIICIIRSLKTPTKHTRFIVLANTVSLSMSDNLIKMRINSMVIHAMAHLVIQ